MEPVLWQTPELMAQVRTQRIDEGWDNVMCAGKTYELSDQVEQINQRLWENGLPSEEDSE